MNLDEAQRPGKDERRSAILKIADEAFRTEGYAATSMSSIAARCGGSKATLYNYFPSKDGLFQAVIQDRCASAGELFERELQEGADFVTGLTNFGNRFLTTILSEPHVKTYRMVIAESERFPEAGRSFYDAGPRRGAEMLGRRIADAIAAGQVRGGDDPLGMARAFLHGCLADLHHRRLFNVEPQPTEADIQANVKRAVTMFMAAYGIAPEKPVPANPGVGEFTGA